METRTKNIIMLTVGLIAVAWLYNNYQKNHKKKSGLSAPKTTSGNETTSGNLFTTGNETTTGNMTTSGNLFTTGG